MLKRLSYKRKLAIVISITCAVSAAATYTLLSLAQSAAKKIVAARQPVSDIDRYTSMGYSFDTVTKKKSIIFSITDDGSLCRSHIFSFDLDLHTLDILELPPCALITADGFKGELSTAYREGIYGIAVSEALSLKIDGSITMDIDDFSDCVAALGGVKVKIEEEAMIGDYRLVSGERIITKSIAERIASDSEAYLNGSRENIEAYRRLLAGVIMNLNQKGASVWFAQLLGVIANGIDTDMNLSEITELASISNEVRTENSHIWLLPGADADLDGRKVYAADVESAASLLNERFRSKGDVCYPEELGLVAISEENPVNDKYKDLETNIKNMT